MIDHAINDIDYTISDTAFIAAITQNTLFDIKIITFNDNLKTALIAVSKVIIMAIMPYYFVSIPDVSDDIVM